MRKFNSDKALNRLELKRKWRNCSKYFYIGIPCLLCCILGIYFAYSKFSTSKEQDVVQTKVGDFIYGDVVIGAYIDGKYSSTIPSKDDGYIVEKVVCDNDAIGTWNNDSWGLLTTNLTKRTKCNVYFVKSSISQIIADLDTTGKCPTVNDDGSVVTPTSVEDSSGYLCSAPDAYGTSYYYRGTVDNNYVYFAGFYWRIVRINGDGSIRIIYDGTSAHANGESSTDRHIGTRTFNSSYNDNAYVGYMYGKTGASTYAETHANTNSSTIKTYLDNWYQNNILETEYEQYIADNLFCNDRSFESSNTGTGKGTSLTYYRWYSDSPAKLLLTCPQQNDAFTVSDTTNGNGALTYPIGLLTADEFLLAGGNYKNSNKKFYLYTGNYEWFLSPRAFLGSYSYGRLQSSSGNLTNINVGYSNSGVRAILNLKSGISLSGVGTMEDPYKISAQ